MNFKLKKNIPLLSPKERLYGLAKPIIGLTGGIATGKSTVCNILREKGLYIIDADQLIHEIYAEDASSEFIGKHAPEAMTKEGEIDFRMLRELFFQQPELKKKILEFLYPKLGNKFTEMVNNADASTVIYDVPLLFERGLQGLVDLRVCVYAPKSVQRLRLAARDSSSEELIDQIMAQQLDIEFKKRNSDYVIDNSEEDLTTLPLEVQKFIDYAFDSGK